MFQGVVGEITAKAYDTVGTDEYYRQSNKTLKIFGKSVIASILATFFVCMSF